MRKCELFEEELETYIMNGDLVREITEEEKKELFNKYEVYEEYFDCGDLCWDSNMVEVLAELHLIKD